ncbi:MAG TPA: UDP-N-acetylglucosamine 2-epimerase (non-hydrolyzing) [Thermoanaerobaculia bacterium]|nr:UDP-N-acetylglucosamine 2-epimerase (non-hydrolyzing) [Thermoanaerobaculia bacterium]
MRMMTIVGARPQLIKAAMVSRIVRAQPEWGIEEILVHTGQHYDPEMSSIFFEQLQIPSPDYMLEIREKTHAAMTGKMMIAIEELITQLHPDLMLVYGDTNSTVAGALTAAKSGVPLAHVEAGLRSFRQTMPEEVNRVVTDHLSRWLFAPTDRAVRNLADEGVTDSARRSVVKVGDVMFDAALLIADHARPSSQVRNLIADLGERFVVVTIHREENVLDDARLEDLTLALVNVAEIVPVVFPMHPRTRTRMKSDLLRNACIHLLPPVGYMDMVTLLRRSSAVLTDSGGLVKEAFFFGKPSVILRDETEWTELVELGAARIAGTRPERVREELEIALAKEAQWLEARPYGDGTAASQIVRCLSAS